MDSETIHASAVLVGRFAVLIRGPSGMGKSTLARRLVERRDGGFARLIADDRVLLRAMHGRLIAAPHPALAGIVELRGHGLDALPHEARGVVALDVLVSLNEAERMPARASVSHCGVTVPHVTIDRTLDAVAVVLAHLRDTER